MKSLYSIIAGLVSAFLIFSLVSCSYVSKGSEDENQAEESILTEADVYDPTSPEYSSAGATRSINIDTPFSGVRAAAGVDLYYTQNNDAPVAVITGNRDIISRITFSVNNGILSFNLPEINMPDVNINGVNNNVNITIDNKNNSGRSVESVEDNSVVKIALNGPLLYDYFSGSSASLHVMTPVMSDRDLEFKASSSGRIEMNQQISCAKEIEVEASSSGAVIFVEAVLADQMSIESSSSGIVNLNGLKSGELEVETGSAATVRIAGLQAKQASFEAASASSVSVSGEAAEAQFEASSAATINARGLKTGKILSNQANSGATVNL